MKAHLARALLLLMGSFKGLAAFALICVGVAFLLSWPAALVVAGVLLLIDRMTTT